MENYGGPTDEPADRKTDGQKQYNMPILLRKGHIKIGQCITFFIFFLFKCQLLSTSGNFNIFVKYLYPFITIHDTVPSIWTCLSTEKNLASSILIFFREKGQICCNGFIWDDTEKICKGTYQDVCQVMLFHFSDSLTPEEKNKQVTPPPLII